MPGVELCCRREKRCLQSGDPLVVTSVVIEETIVELGVEIVEMALHLILVAALHLVEGDLEVGIHGTMAALESGIVGVAGKIQNRTNLIPKC